MTALLCEGVDASEVVEELQNRHNIVVAPSGGQLKSRVIRVAHMGAQNDADVASLISALRDIASHAAHSLIERVEA
jgi:aspartate aminotransferase-like enzyme